MTHEEILEMRAAVAQQTAEYATRGLDANGGIVDMGKYDAYCRQNGK